MLRELKRFLFPSELTAHQMAVIELQQAQRDWLAEKSKSEYHARMVQYHADRITRLEASVGDRAK